MNDVTRLIEAAKSGDRHAAAELMPLVYDELRKLAQVKLAGERPDHTLNATALVHEAYLRLIGDQQFDGRGHFFAAAAEAMRRILVDQARARLALKRDGVRNRVALDPDNLAQQQADTELLHVHETLREMAAIYPEHASLVSLRYFGGLSADEAAFTLGISASTADRRWAFARAWLKSNMAPS